MTKFINGKRVNKKLGCFSRPTRSDIGSLMSNSTKYTFSFRSCLSTKRSSRTFYSSRTSPALAAALRVRQLLSRRSTLQQAPKARWVEVVVRLRFEIRTFSRRRLETAETAARATTTTSTRAAVSSRLRRRPSRANSLDESPWSSLNVHVLFGSVFLASRFNSLFLSYCLTRLFRSYLKMKKAISILQREKVIFNSVSALFPRSFVFFHFISFGLFLNRFFKDLLSFSILFSEASIFYSKE